MRTRTSTIRFHIPAVAGGFLLTSFIVAGGCSSKPSGLVVASGTAGNAGAGNGVGVGGAGMPGGGAGNGTNGGTGNGTNGGTGNGTNGGAGNATNGGAGQMAMGTCTDPYSAPRASMIGDPKAVASTVTQLTVPRRIAVISGGPVLAGNKYGTDFDGTEAPEIGLNKFAMRDGPRGVHQIGGATAPATTWAVAEARAASFDLALEEKVGEVQGSEMIALKYDLSLAPTMNVLRHPGWGRAQETYGEDPVLVGEMAGAFVKGMQANYQMMACPKHFAVNNTENSRHEMNAVIDDQTLRENYVRNFEIMIKRSDPACIMASYNRISGLHATENPKLLTDILRTELHWTGFTLSDWWATVDGAGAASLKAGLDYEMPDNQAFRTLQSDLTSNLVTTERLNEAVGRMVNARLKFKQDTAAYKNKPANNTVATTPDHIALARLTAEEGAVLLKNDNFLPLGPNATKLGKGTPNAVNIKFIGPDKDIPLFPDPGSGHAGLGDGGSSNTLAPYAISYQQGLKNYATDNGITLNVTSSANAADAAGADVVIIPVTMWWPDEGEAFSEGHDRVDLLLSGQHPIHWTVKPASFIKQVTAVNPNVIVLLNIGSAVIMEDWFQSAKAVIQPFYPGQEGGNAMAKLLFGNIDFTGRLPFTIAASPGDYPAFNNNNPGDVPIGYFHGYRKIEKDNKTPTFWFGEGLSYNAYTFSNLTIGCANTSVAKNAVLNATVDVQNNGMMDSDEVVQVYIGYPSTAVQRPVKELKTFLRVHLKAGEKQTVSIAVPVEDMAYWKNGAGWTVEAGAHTLLVGGSAKPADLQTASFTIN
jgi:beta-glucosidase